MEKESSKNQYDAKIDDLAKDMYTKDSGNSEKSFDKIKYELEEGYKKLQILIAEKLSPLKQLNIDPSIIAMVESQVKSNAKKDFLQTMERFDISEINKVVSDVALNAIKPIIPQEHDDENNLSNSNRTSVIEEKVNRYFENMLNKDDKNTEKLSTEKMSLEETKKYVESRLSKMGRKTQETPFTSYEEQQNAENDAEKKLMEGIVVPDNASQNVKNAIEVAKQLSHYRVADASNPEKKQIIYYMYQFKKANDPTLDKVLVSLDNLLGYGLTKVDENGEVIFDEELLKSIAISIDMTKEEIEDMFKQSEYASTQQDNNSKNNPEQENQKQEDQKQEILNTVLYSDGDIYKERMSQLAKEDINSVNDVYNTLNQPGITGNLKEQVDVLSEIIQQEQEELLKKSFEGDMQTFQKEILGLVKINPNTAKEFLKSIFADRDISEQNIEQKAILLQNAIKQAEDEKSVDGQEQQIDPIEKLKDSFKKSDSEFQQEIGDIAKSDLESANRFLKDMFKDDPQAVQEHQNKILMLQEAIKQAEKEKLKDAFTKGDKEFKRDVTEVVNDDPAVAQEFLKEFLKDENKTVGEYGGRISFLQENISKALEGRTSAKKSSVLSADNVEISDLRGDTSLTEKEGQSVDDDGR